MRLVNTLPTLRYNLQSAFGRALVVLVCGLLVAVDLPLVGQTPPATGTAAPAAAAEEEEKPLTADQLDSLVAPIALYPDDLLAQCLAASTYPLELMQLKQWMEKHKDLKDKALADAVAKQPWDPSVQSMAAVPDALKRLTDDIQWTTDLGNAFLDQQKEVMDACQRMRKKASDKGALKSNEQMKVETKVIESKETIIIQPSNPEVIYVPSYNPTVVYPPPPYPYPPVYYPPYTPGAAFFTFSAGMMMGAAIWGGSCCGCGWGGGNVNVNVNNNFNRNTNVSGKGGQGGGNWNHNASHRGGTPYGSNKSAGKYGGQTRGQQASARQQGGRGTGAGAGGRGGAGGAGASSMDRGGGGGRGGADRGGASVSDRSAGGSNRGGGGSDRVGSRDVGGGGGSHGGGSGFGGSSGGFSGSSARSSSSRGASSMGSRGGGGGGRGGGGRGGRR